jgi:ribonuclease G
MSDEILINVGVGETRIALVDEGVLRDLVIERSVDDSAHGPCSAGTTGASLVGNLMIGRVERVLPGMQAAFVDIGLPRSGFLGVREAQCLCELMGLDNARTQGRMPRINDCVREGEKVLVQVLKDPIGDKGPRLSANVTIPGRLLVLVPHQPGVALSRRIEDEDDRARLTELVQRVCADVAEKEEGDDLARAGWIVRTAALQADEDALERDARHVLETWREVRERAKGMNGPATVFKELGPVQRVLRDHLNEETGSVLIDDADAYVKARAYCDAVMPGYAGRLKHHAARTPLFAAYGVEDEIEAALSSRVELPSGGWITVERTEALTAIDVNSGSFTAATDLEQTSRRINLEAADAIARQVRVRGVGGLVIIDFIHLAEEEHRQEVVARLEAGFEGDRTPTQILPMSEFSTVEMTRKRVREPLDRLLLEPIRRDANKTRATVAYEALRATEAAAADQPGRALALHVCPPVAEWLEESGLMPQLRARLGVDVTLHPVDGARRHHIDIAAGA